MKPFPQSVFIVRLWTLRDMNQLVKLETLDTSFVNLGALIRHLRQRNFVGRVKIALEEYEADVFLYGSEEPRIWEKNHTTGRGAQGKDAMERLLVRARDPGGVITIYEGPDETANANQSSSASTETRVDPETQDSPESIVAAAVPVIQPELNDEIDWDNLLAASAELIAAVERAADSVHEDFASHFRSALIAIGDDYPFLDPTAGIFQYRNAKVHLRQQPDGADFISSLTESLSRVVSKLVTGNAGERFRERVAVELAVVARRKGNVFNEFTSRLDRIAGTRVL